VEVQVVLLAAMKALPLFVINLLTEKRSSRESNALIVGEQKEKIKSFLFP
jgi:hypothetical protein